MQKDLNKILIESMLKTAMKDIHCSPGRTVRNLIDLAVNFSKGRFQKNFMRVIQNMLQNTDSAYYQLCTDSISNVDMDYLIHFGMNLGYNGCTKGAALIRKIEEEKGFNIPWSLTLQINLEKLQSDPNLYPDILRQGLALGICTYFLFLPSGDAEKLIPIFEGQPDCAFLLFLRGHQITETLIKHAEKSKNVLIFVFKNEEMPEACIKLREAKLPYAVYQRYTEDDVEKIVNGQWITEILPYHPQVALLLAHESCTVKTCEKVYQCILSTRRSQKYPVLFVDGVVDVWKIDNIISDDAYVVGFLDDGNMRTYDGRRKEENYNIFQNSLEDVLRNTIKK